MDTVSHGHTSDFHLSTNVKIPGENANQTSTFPSDALLTARLGAQTRFVLSYPFASIFCHKPDSCTFHGRVSAADWICNDILRHWRDLLSQFQVQRPWKRYCWCLIIVHWLISRKQYHSNLNRYVFWIVAVWSLRVARRFTRATYSKLQQTWMSNTNAVSKRDVLHDPIFNNNAQ